MSDIELIEEHLIIRETIGYDLIKEADPCDLPEVLKFLKIVNNYQKMNLILNG
jgi:hypothetical protein